MCDTTYTAHMWLRLYVLPINTNKEEGRVRGCSSHWRMVPDRGGMDDVSWELLLV